jgi:outer membrane protein
MNKILLIVTLFFAITHNITAQKFGHFSSEYVVKKIPTYQQAQKEIDMLSQVWMEDVKNKYIESGRLQNKLEAEKILLTSEMILERENGIELKLKEAIDYQYRTFGPDGLFFIKKKELLKPELDKIFEAVERVCKKQRLDYLMDKSSELVMVYTNPVHDYTDFVLDELGLGDPNDSIK